jgi:hypothetical protein
MVKPHSPIAQCKTIDRPHADGRRLYSFDHDDRAAAPMTKPQHHLKEDRWKSCPELALAVSSFRTHTPHSLPTDARPDNRPARVRFENRVRMKEVPHRNNMSPKMIQSTWLTKDDYLTTKEMLRKTIRLMMANEIVDEDDDGLCARGLEGQTAEGSSFRMQFKLRVRVAVLLEQHQQRITGKLDPEKISLICSTWSSQCVLEARTKALRDARDAKEHWNASTLAVAKSDTHRVCMDHDDGSTSSSRSYMEAKQFFRTRVQTSKFLLYDKCSGLPQNIACNQQQ